MDLPAYKKPLFGYDFKLVLEKVWGFITGAGKIIFVVSIIIWVLSYFGPKTNSGEMVSTDVHLDHSYLAKLKTFSPFGFTSLRIFSITFPSGASSSKLYKVDMVPTKTSLAAKLVRIPTPIFQS